MNSVETSSSDIVVTRAAISLYCRIGAVSPAHLGRFEWMAGCVEWPIPDEPGEHTDSTWRKRVLHPRAHGALYDGNRWWRPINSSNSCFLHASFSVTALEILAVPTMQNNSAKAILAIHAECGELELRKLSSIVKTIARPNPGKSFLWHVPDDMGGSDINFLDTSASVLLLAVTSESWEDRSDKEKWSATDVWGWALARATVPTRRAIRRAEKPPNPGSRYVLPRRLMYVDSRGAALIGTRKDRGSSDTTKAYTFDLVATQSIYSDAFVAGMMTKELLDDLALAASQFISSRRRVGSLRELEDQWRTVRNRYFWNRFSYWKWPDLLLQGFNLENDLQEMRNTIQQDFTDISEGIDRQFSQRISNILLLLGVLSLMGTVASVIAALELEFELAASILAVATVATLIVASLLWRSKL